MNAIRPWIKICGVTRPEDAELAVALGATHLGVNFWPRSPRYVEAERACEIVASVGSRVPVAGVLVNQDPEKIEELVEKVGLDLVQFHGDEPEEWIRRLARRAIRAIRWEDTGSSGAVKATVYDELYGWVLDGPAGELYGGSGRSWSWHRARPFVERARSPVMIAGGIRPGNAASALAVSGAAGVDVASGVESSPGVKDPEKMQRLIEEITGGTFET
jgi:phosphoribosylanthranilate isomerase